MRQKKIISIIGAGPSGMIAAETLAKGGHSVTIYDQMPTPARKFLIAGRGGLNLTHSEDLTKFLTRYGEARDWLEPSIRAFTPDDLRAWCTSLGEETFIGSSGRVFPRKMKAVQLLRAWIKKLESLNVQYSPRHRWLGWEGNNLLFDKKTVETDATLLALGGASWPRLGSDGVWTEILNRAGVEISPLRPANCGFVTKWSDYFSSRFAGSPLKPVILTHKNISIQGEAMITALGIEGSAIYAISKHLRQDIETAGQALLHIDLSPNKTELSLTQKFLNPRGSQSYSTFLRKCGLSPLIIALIRENSSTQLPAQKLAHLIKNYPLTLTATAGLARAISTAGGISQSALDQNFMLKAKPGTFASGEMLNWEAPTGGYLLQACFSTGVAAAKGIMHYLKA